MNILNKLRTIIVNEVSNHNFDLIVHSVTCLEVRDLLLETNVVDSVVNDFKA